MFDIPRAAAVIGMMLMQAVAARAEIVDIAWDAGGAFERNFDVAPGRFSELCGPLKPGQSVVWQFEADQPLNANIHYHEGKAVRYPARADGVRSQQGTLSIESAQDYCWMWSNKSVSNARLRVRLQLR
jgi:hypothetical protein